MKKLLLLALMLSMVIAMVSCSALTDSIKNMLGMDSGEGEHVHDFIPSGDVVAPTCSEDGYSISVCSCGEENHIDIVPATGHDLIDNGTTQPSCTNSGVGKYKCTNCDHTEIKLINPLGHEYGASPEASRFAMCTREGCGDGAFLTESDGTYAEILTFTFGDEDDAALDAKYAEILSKLEAAPEYDPALHAYAAEGELADDYAEIDALHTEYYDLIMDMIAQYQISMVDYYCDMDNSTLEKNYSSMMDYYTNTIATFYSLSQPFYDSCYRDFFYYGMSEQEIKAYLFESSAVSNPEYMALKARNDQIELHMLSISDPTKGMEVPNLYAEFVKNNNAMAKLMGYDNYLEYAYENVYDREYSYQNVADINGYIVEYIVPALNSVNEKKNQASSGNYSMADYHSIVSSSFFSSVKSNTVLNDYIDLMAFNADSDNQISFSDEFNKLMQSGNMFRGEYSGAFVTYFSAYDLPIAYFSEGYDNAFTVAHEFGHYMNEIYNRSEYSQSYDLLEVHSQGNEMLYLNFLSTQLDEATFTVIESQQVLDLLSIVMMATAVDSFEQAVYLNYYDGTGSDEIMADGNITADEFDLLFYGVIADLGALNYVNPFYWRYGMTILSPCYYISYAVSALSALEIYEIAATEGHDAAAEAYLKLFTYTDENPDMTFAKVLEYAGMHSYNNEELYKSLYEFLK